MLTAVWIGGVSVIEAQRRTGGDIKLAILKFRAAANNHIARIDIDYAADVLKICCKGKRARVLIEDSFIGECTARDAQKTAGYHAAVIGDGASDLVGKGGATGQSHSVDDGDRPVVGEGGSGESAAIESEIAVVGQGNAIGGPLNDGGADQGQQILTIGDGAILFKKNR
jgi:hypothetical protein